MKNDRKRWRRAATWFVALIATAAAIYVVALRPTDVTPLAASFGTVLREALGTGSIESRQTIDIGFEVTGRVIRIDVDQNDTVKEGQELAAIDDGTFLAQVALAEQGVVLAESTLQRLEADIERSHAILKGAEDGLRRIAPLVEKGVASQEALDVADERLKVARAELSRSQAAQVEGRESVATAYRELDRAQAEFERTVVRSPFQGLVLHRVREVGDIVVPGSAILRLAATGTVWASVWVDETHLASLATGLPARIALRSDPERELRGTVSRIRREVDRETRELLVDVSFDEMPAKLAFGQRVDLWIELNRRSDVLRVPARALIERDGREGVYVAAGSRAEFRALDLGQRGRTHVEVEGGLSEDTVVLDPRPEGSTLLRDGERIRVIEKAHR